MVAKEKTNAAKENPENKLIFRIFLSNKGFFLSNLSEILISNICLAAKHFFKSTFFLYQNFTEVAKEKFLVAKENPENKQFQDFP